MKGSKIEIRYNPKIKLHDISQLPLLLNIPIKRAAKNHRLENIDNPRMDDNSFMAGGFFMLNNPELMKYLIAAKKFKDT